VRQQCLDERVELILKKKKLNDSSNMIVQYKFSCYINSTSLESVAFNVYPAFKTVSESSLRKKLRQEQTQKYLAMIKDIFGG